MGRDYCDRRAVRQVGNRAGKPESGRPKRIGKGLHSRTARLLALLLQLAPALVGEFRLTLGGLAGEVVPRLIDGEVQGFRFYVGVNVFAANRHVRLYSKSMFGLRYLI